MSFIIGLTGPTGAGKSTVSAAAEQFGLKVVNCDLLARKAVYGGFKGVNRRVRERYFRKRRQP